MKPDAALQERVERLAKKLEEVRRHHAERPEEERRAAFELTLDEELGQVPAADADRVIQDVRERMIHDARQRDQRVEHLEAMIREQQATIEELRRNQAQVQVQPAPAPIAAAGPAPNMDAIRAALSKVIEGKTPDVATLGLTAQDASLYSLIAGLMQFTMSYGEGRTWILASLGVGAAAHADSVMIKGIQDRAKKSMKGCLAGDAAAGEMLQEELKVYAKFLIGLNESFQSCIDAGSRKLLAQLAHQELLGKHKRLVGLDYEAAWKELEGIHARLNDLSRGEIWEQYYLEPFRAKLGAGK